MNDNLNLVRWLLLFAILFNALFVVFIFAEKVIELNDKVWELHLNDLTRAYQVDKERYH